MRSSAITIAGSVLNENSSEISEPVTTRRVRKEETHRTLQDEQPASSPSNIPIQIQNNQKEI